MAEYARERQRENTLLSRSIAKQLKLYPSFETAEFREFCSIVQKKIEEMGMIDLLDETHSACVENGSTFFVELALHDGSWIARGEELILEISNSFKHEHVRVMGVVRAHWTVAEIQHVGTCTDDSGLPRNSECFKVELRAGEGKQIVEVEVTPGAFEKIDRRLGKGMQIAQQVIRKMLEENLKQGGQSYWHPIRNPKHRLDELAAQVMIHKIEHPDAT